MIDCYWMDPLELICAQLSLDSCSLAILSFRVWLLVFLSTGGWLAGGAFLPLLRLTLGAAAVVLVTFSRLGTFLRWCGAGCWQVDLRAVSLGAMLSFDCLVIGA